MRIKSLFLLSILSISSFAQQEVIGVPTYRPQNQAPMMKTGDTLNLPFKDDFSGAVGFPNQRRWTDSKGYVNNTFPINQPSRGVLTLDGLNEGGRAYDLSHSASDTLADVVTSAYLDLSTATSPFLNFMYQEGGFGEAPESNDSLVVDFWHVDSARWERVWSVRGGELQNDEWRWAAISANHPKWLKDGFRFRIGTYGALNGAFDVWNVDYLSMESFRSPQDTVIEDPAITLALPSLTTNFTQVPWFHMPNAQLKLLLNLSYRRNGPAPVGGWQLYLRNYNLYQDGNLVDGNIDNTVNSSLDHNQNLNYLLPIASGSVNKSATQATTVQLETWISGDANAIGIQKNDTIVHTQRFSNVYAFDDGSAERVYGLTQSNSYILYRFQPLLSDTLKGLQMYFGEADADQSNSPFQIVVFNFQNNAPGSIRYISDQIYYPQYAGAQNQFYSYPLDTSGLYINGTVYIGVKQLSSVPLTIGLDRNTDSLNQIVYGDGVNWFPSLEKNSHLMMRPYFQYHPTDISVGEWNDVEQAVLYPNPSNGRFRIDLSEWTTAQMTVLDLSGKTYWIGEIENGQEVDLSSLRSGVYLCRLVNGSEVYSIKIIIQN